MEETMRPTTAFDDNVFDFTALLHPGTVFDHPRDVVAHPSLSISEKRAILASWASDAAAIASCPALRAPAGLKVPITIDEILKALCELVRRAVSQTVCVRRRGHWRRSGRDVMDEIRLPKHVVSRIERWWASRLAQRLEDGERPERAPSSSASESYDPLQSPQVRRLLEGSLRPPTSLSFQ
jgi:hypothetical protein